MATFPDTFAQSVDDSSEEFIPNVEEVQNDDGSARVRVRGVLLKKFITVLLVRSDADKATLLTFYNTNVALTFNFKWQIDGVTYTPCVFYARPTIKSMSQPGEWEITMFIREQS